MGDSPNRVELVSQAEAYFKELVTEALDKQRLKVLPETEFYLVNLLKQFMNTENLYVRDSNGNYKTEPLVLKLKEALEETQPKAQQLLYRHLGDVSLYVAGFFQESLGRRLVDVDYYIGLGGGAYRRVAHLEEVNLRSKYEELADKFSKLVGVFCEVSASTSTAREENTIDVLRLYDLWLNTKSERAERALKKVGIIPVAQSNRKLS